MEPDVLCFAAATRCCCKRGDWESAVTVLEATIRKGLLPASRTVQARNRTTCCFCFMGANADYHTGASSYKLNRKLANPYAIPLNCESFPTSCATPGLHLDVHASFHYKPRCDLLCIQAVARLCGKAGKYAPLWDIKELMRDLVKGGGMTRPGSWIYASLIRVSVRVFWNPRRFLQIKCVRKLYNKWVQGNGVFPFARERRTGICLCDLCRKGRRVHPRQELKGERRR